MLRILDRANGSEILRMRLFAVESLFCRALSLTTRSSRRRILCDLRNLERGSHPLGLEVRIGAYGYRPGA